MTILTGDIVLAASQIMDDVPEGGGAPSSRVIADGVKNGIFPDVSELDRTIGRVNMRKVFPSVRTANVDGYYGVNTIISEPPTDPSVSVTLFTTGNVFDTREDAALRVESYLAQGPIYQAYLFGNAITGQASITMLQRTELPLPTNGDTLVLVVNEGMSTQQIQYVRVTTINSRARTFTDNIGDFTRTEITLGLSDTLRHDFPGQQGAIRFDYSIDYTGKAKVYSSTVANAAQYYGVVPLENAAGIGDVVIQAESIFNQIVPSTRVEIPVSNARMNQQLGALVSAGDSIYTVVTATLTTSQRLFIGGGILPGSLTVTRAGISLTDRGGALYQNTTAVGTVDYANGILSLSTNVFGASAGTFAIAYTPATTPTIVAESIGVPVTSNNQRLSWLFDVEPIPARASLTVSYRALGHWYQLNEDGSGALRGADSSYGAGSINFSTGGLSVTLGALPDVASQIILTWAPAIGSTAITDLHSNDPNALQPAFGKTVTLGQGVKPGGITLTWNDGTARTATDVNGKLTGDATGLVNYATGAIEFRPNLLPAKDTNIGLAVTNATAQTKSVAQFDTVDTFFSFQLVGPIKPRSVEIAILVSLTMRAYPGTDSSVQQYLRVTDDGSGLLSVPNVTGYLAIGVVDYTSGACTITKTITNYLSVQPTFKTSYVFDGAGGSVSKIAQTGTENRNVTLTVAVGFGGVAAPTVPSWAWFGPSAAAAEARYAGSDGSGGSYPFVFDSIFLPSPKAMPSMFYIGPHVYQWDAASSSYILDANLATGAGTTGGTRSVAGSVSGVLVSNWPSGASSAPINIVGTTTPSIATVLAESVTFRTAISPLFNGGFTIVLTDGQGEASTVTADVNGRILGPNVAGVINYATGVCTLRFGTVGGPTNATTQNIDYLNIPTITSINPQGMRADSLRYNAVGYSYIPLNADLLGLDPVRLPPDGRVPIFKSGTVAVIGCTRKLGAFTASNGQTVDTSQVRLSRVRVLGANGLVINTGYTADLEAGHVTFNDVSGYSQPVTVEYRIEDMSLVSDAQISGQLTLTKALTHAYPADGTSYVSSALTSGDMHARVSTVFDQQSWSNVFSGDLVGSPATGTFNNIASPIGVTNIGALTERWAVVFTNSTAFNIIGEHVGVIAVGNTSTDAAPLNPATGQPYFTIPAIGWGSGWVPGNVLRFDTVGALAPVWVLRTIQQSTPTVDQDQFTLLVRGDVNAS